jgi:hypothetical protein
MSGAMVDFEALMAAFLIAANPACKMLKRLLNMQKLIKEVREKGV